jgi:hypothetical protein
MSGDDDLWLLIIFVSPILVFIALMLLVNWLACGNPLDDGGR